MTQRFSCERSAKHLVSYSADAGLGAFAFGQSAQALVVVTELQLFQSGINNRTDIDWDGDGFVGIEDLNLVLGNFNAGTPPSGDANVIPEPATLLMLAFETGLLGSGGSTFNQSIGFSDR